MTCAFPQFAVVSEAAATPAPPWRGHAQRNRLAPLGVEPATGRGVLDRTTCALWTHPYDDPVPGALLVELAVSTTVWNRAEGSRRAAGRPRPSRRIGSRAAARLRSAGRPTSASGRSPARARGRPPARSRSADRRGSCVPCCAGIGHRSPSPSDMRLLDQVGAGCGASPRAGSGRWSSVRCTTTASAAAAAPGCAAEGRTPPRSRRPRPPRPLEQVSPSSRSSSITPTGRIGTVEPDDPIAPPGLQTQLLVLLLVVHPGELRHRLSHRSAVVHRDDERTEAVPGRTVDVELPFARARRRTSRDNAVDPARCKTPTPDPARRTTRLRSRIAGVQVPTGFALHLSRNSRRG